jgi:Nucleotidyltransferase substrate binding protein like
MNGSDVESLDRLNAAIARLSEALLLPVGQGVNLDGTIQRFEFTFELLWKSAKRALLAQGIDARPRYSSASTG